MEHYEDLKGPNDYSLNTFVYANIISMEIGSMGVSSSQRFRIAVESAAFELYISQFDYDMFAHG